MNLPPLLATHLGRGENGKPLQSSLTFAYGGKALSNNIGENLPSNATFLSHHAQPFIPASLSIPNGFMPTHIHSYQQPTSFVNGQHLSLPTQNPPGNLPMGGIPVHLSQEGHAPQTFVNSNTPSQNGLAYPANMPTNGYPFYKQPMYTFPNVHVYTNPNLTGAILNLVGSERTKSYDTPREESKKDKGTTPTKAPILMVSREAHIAKSLAQESIDYVGKEIIFPPIAKVNNAPVIIEAKIFGRKVGREYMDNGSSCEIICEHCFEKLNPTNKATKVDLKTSLVGFLGERSWSIGIGTVLSADETDEGMKRAKKILATNEERVLSCVNTEEKVIVNDKYLNQTVIIRKQLPEHFKKELQNLLKSNAEVFAWTHANMTGIPRTIMVEGKPFNTEHKLNGYSHVKPIEQNKRGLGPDRNMAACKETEKLTKAGILQKVKHQTWVANPVMVKKSDGGWRMCVDFTDINKAYPKDCYPLPEIDWKIESLSGFHLKCFLDAYKGATYQRLVDKVFSHQIRRNLEAYVDDMVIKSTSEKEMLKDIQETFKRFRSINMKLNPKKCSFGVEEGLVSGHLITKQGIKANRSKYKAVTDLDQLRTLKDIKSLKGKLAALSRFLSKGAKRSLDFFKVLKGSKDKKNIQWTTEADKALEKMKKLVQQHSLHQGVLQEAKLNYPPLEKLVLALVHATRRLQRYFQAHTIMVLTNTPIKQMLTGPVKIPFEDNEKKEKPKEVPDSNSKWRLYTDGASNSDGERAGLMLIDPEGKEYTYALRFKFETTNNKAEYEALLAGLRIAQEMEIAKVAIFLDSQLLMHMEAAKAIQDCEKCKEQSAIRKAGISRAIAAGSTWPFRHWGTNNPQSSKEEKHFIEGMFANLCKGLIVTSFFSPVTEHMKIMHHIKRQLTQSQQGWVDNLAKTLWIHRTLPRNSQKETPFSLTYGSKAVILIIESTDDKGRVQKATKGKESMEVASIKNAYYRNKLQKYHRARSSQPMYIVGDFVLLKRNANEWQGPYIIKEVHKEELYTIVDTTDHLLVQIMKGTILRKFYI
nr:hypothetical protein [Tanacetum cinerariifolium]